MIQAPSPRVSRTVEGGMRRRSWSCCLKREAQVYRVVDVVFVIFDLEMGR